MGIATQTAKSRGCLMKDGIEEGKKLSKRESIFPIYNFSKTMRRDLGR